MTTAEFARSLARQHIEYWREAKRDGLPKTAAWSRSQALRYLAEARRYEHG
jgi:hypothetical protein